jgi:PKD repeat protein/predicted secreted protein
MKTKLTLSLLCLFAVLSSFGQKFVRVSQSNSKQTIVLAQDQALEIQLPGQPTTGYGWYIKNSSKNKVAPLLKQIGTWECKFDPTVKGVGGEGTQIIHFTALAQGQAELELVYERPWMGEASATSSYSITVVTSGKYTGVPVALPGTSTVQKPASSSHPSTLGTHPTAFSWLTQGIMTPIEDQGQCGSCWSFAACGVFESQIKYWDNVTKDLSEQWLVNCDANCSGCSGGWCPFDMFQTYGCVYNADLGYSAANGTCAASYTYHEKIVSHTQVNGASPTDDEIKQAIYDHGPVWACIDAGNNFQNYSSGVFSASDGTTLDHAIILCGYDDAQGCWILRNSWNTSWGESGYMRIAYGTSGVGGNAEYMDYKGAIPHSIPPTAAFVSNLNSTCGGAIQFTDQSNNNPTSWAWDFGDGQTSTLQNPSHTYTTSGSFTVKLTATNAFGSNPVTKNNMISVNIMATPTTTGATRVGAGVVNLSATASGTPTLDWYDAATAGNLVHTGTTYSPNLSATTTFYVANENLSPSSHTGLANNTAGGGYYTANTDRRLYFNVLSDMTLESVTIYADSAGTRQIEILDSSGNSVALSATFNAVNGKNIVPLGITLPAKNNYAIKLSATSRMDLFRNNTGVAYPYTVGGLVSIVNSDASTTPGSYYYYFYDWVVSAPSCSSPRVSVIGTINTATGVQNLSANSSMKVYPNPTSGIFMIDGLERDNSVEVFDVVGKVVYQTITSNSTLSVDLSGKDKGVYFYRITNTNSKDIKAGRVVLY